MLSAPISHQCFEHVARRDAQIVERPRVVDEAQLP
jgi:hypothetical protein